MTRGPETDTRLISALRTHVDRLAALIGPRHTFRPGTMDAAAAYIERELSAFGEPVERQTYQAGRASVANLIIERRGTKRPGEIVLLGAHYDTIDATPGADDNASAVAVLLESARLLHGRDFKRTIRFVAFACEEPPHFYCDTMGSQQYARRCRQRNEKITAALVLEMVGYFSDEPHSQRVPDEIPRPLRRLFPRTGNFLTAVGNLSSIKAVLGFRRGFKRATRLPLFAIALPERIHAIRLSDNASFWDQNYPALMITDTSFLRNPHYHLQSDTPDTLNYEKMAQVTLGVAGAMAHMARPM